MKLRPKSLKQGAAMMHCLAWPRGLDVVLRSVHIGPSAGGSENDPVFENLLRENSHAGA